jgi:hypothetical protein
VLLHEHLVGHRAIGSSKSLGELVAILLLALLEVKTRASSSATTWQGRRCPSQRPIRNGRETPYAAPEIVVSIIDKWHQSDRQFALAVVRQRSGTVKDPDDLRDERRERLCDPQFHQAYSAMNKARIRTAIRFPMGRSACSELCVEALLR